VRQLLDRGESVRAIVRSARSLPEDIAAHPGLSIIEASVLDLDHETMKRHVAGCEAVASCLGHNLTFKGVFGHPRRLVRDATRRLCEAISANTPRTPVKFVLMNTTGNSNRDLDEPVSPAQKAVIWLLRLLLPPHADNEEAADYLRTQIGQDHAFIRWAAVRPDGLIDEQQTTRFTLHPSPIRSPIFNPGKTSRMNVGCFMADLITNPAVWNEWKGRMPVIYNEDPQTSAESKP